MNSTNITNSEEVSSDNKPSKGFESLGIPNLLLNLLNAGNFKNPTQIQNDVIPTALEGRDILASSKTGSGKTLAFCVPILAKVINSNSETALILTPTREIALQISKVIHTLLGNERISTALLIGGEEIGIQFKQLKKNPRIIIGTPGRVNDHINRRSLRLGEISIAVLDEVDKMLEMGFDVQIQEIFKYIPEECQKLMFSATIPSKIEQLSKTYLKEPKIISTICAKSSHDEFKKVKQDFHNLNSAPDKYDTLLKELDERQGSVVIFVKTKSTVEDIAHSLRGDDHSVDFIHGDLKQRVREKVIAKFREKKYRILVATDVVARGLDVPHIEHVINFDMPMSVDEYMHRIGRTNRQSGASGSVVNFVSRRDMGIANEIRIKLGHPGVKPVRSEDDRGGFRKKRFGSSGGGSRFGSSGGNGGSNGGGRSRFSDNNGKSSGGSYGGESNSGGSYGGSGGNSRPKKFSGQKKKSSW